MRAVLAIISAPLLFLLFILFVFVGLPIAFLQAVNSEPTGE